MTKDDLMQMAREAKCGHESMTLDWIPPDGLEQFANAVLERAAVECDVLRENHRSSAKEEDSKNPKYPKYISANWYYVTCLTGVASDIRALKIPEGE